MPSTRILLQNTDASGELALGSRLDENQLAARFGVSRTPIREALLQLAVTGLIQTKPRRGAIVSAPEPHLLLAMFETMAEIEAIFDSLEAAGHPVAAEPKNPPAALAKVLSTVRSFSALSGRKPTLSEIAQHSGLSLGEVRFALLYARVLVR